MRPQILTLPECADPYDSPCSVAIIMAGASHRQHLWPVDYDCPTSPGFPRFQSNPSRKSFLTEKLPRPETHQCPPCPAAICRVGCVPLFPASASPPECNPLLNDHHRIYPGRDTRPAPFERNCPVASGFKRARYRGAVMGTKGPA